MLIAGRISRHDLHWAPHAPKLTTPTTEFHVVGAAALCRVAATSLFEQHRHRLQYGVIGANLNFGQI
jgi:hypothetical protein